MEMDKTSRAHGRVVATAVIAIVALGCAILIGFLATRSAKAGPSAQSVIDFLANPIPLPQGARLLQTIGSGNVVGEGFVDWDRDFVVDITGMKPGERDAAVGERDAVVGAYVDHFLRQFPMGIGGSTSWSRLHKSADKGFVLMGGLDRGWTTTYFDQLGNKHYSLTIDAQVIDFEPNPPAGTMSKRQVVSDWSAPPPYGQRVMWLRVSFKATGLTGYGKWPESPASTPASASQP